ncbi:CRISPR-associated endonuclease Cas6 [uncultured Ilyobacter sp.]|uniref:CRISPR-associated endonuclease Cas6 n=1 Tax=uncultured Ilyobacter sp. TaxID=544433 RepID=UPI0029C8D29D|nr:CRISPR-associated endonuclease Cas6 [uncultured Ilyobacter sp.]
MKLVMVKFKTEEKFDNRDSEKLRGYIGNLFSSNVLFHNHLGKYEFLYKSSKIYYRVIEGELSIVGICQGAELLLEKAGDINEVVIGGKTHEILRKEIIEKEFDLNIGDTLHKYKFDTLWMALNDKNYKKYKSGEFFLDRNLQNNIIEFFKLCGVWADKPIMVKGEYKEHKITKKDTSLIGFSGWFVTNVKLPDYISLGKRKSIGFGSIKRE